MERAALFQIGPFSGLRQQITSTREGALDTRQSSKEPSEQPAERITEVETTSSKDKDRFNIQIPRPFPAKAWPAEPLDTGLARGNPQSLAPSLFSIGG